jgi:hypothetical protein
VKVIAPFGGGEEFAKEILLQGKENKAVMA